MNTTFPTVSIDVILERQTAKEVLNAILHAILFHRLFGTVKAQTFDVLDVTMPGVADPEMEQLVNDKVDVFWKGIESGSSKRGQRFWSPSRRRNLRSLGFRCMSEKRMYHGNNGSSTRN